MKRSLGFPNYDQTGWKHQEPSRKHWRQGGLGGQKGKGGVERQRCSLKFTLADLGLPPEWA